MVTLPPKHRKLVKDLIELVKIVLAKENYLADKRFTKSECELLFALRTRMVTGIKTNFSSQYGNNLTCQLCSGNSDSDYQDSQEHLLSCVTLSKHVQVPTDIEYEDIYRSVEKQLKIVKVFKQILRVREMLNAQCDEQSHQMMSPVAPVKVTVSQ